MAPPSPRPAKPAADGVFKTSLDALKDLGDVRVFALRSGHAAAFNLPLAGLELSSGLKAKGYLYTDRPAYLPGETVSMRGVLRDVKNDAYAIPEDCRIQNPLLRSARPAALRTGRETQQVRHLRCDARACRNKPPSANTR